VERSGYCPDAEREPTEYLCPIAESHIEVFLSRDPFKTHQPYLINDVGQLPIDQYFNTPERIQKLGLSRVLMVPVDTQGSDCENYFLNIYFKDGATSLVDSESVISTISLKAAALLMSSFDVKRSEIGRAFERLAISTSGRLHDLLPDVVKKVLPSAI